MILRGFTLLRIFTSLVRWITSFATFFSTALLNHPASLMLTPPFFRHQIILSRETGMKLYRVTLGSYWDWATCQEIFVRREYEIERFVQGRQLLHKIDNLGGESLTVYDIGGNIGVAANFFLHRFQNAQVISVEPSSANHLLLERNLRHQKRATLVQAAIGPKSGEVDLFDPGLGNNAFSTEKSSHPVIETVMQITMKELFESFPVTQVAIVKIDIEGAEKALFSEDTNWLSKADLVIIETHDWLLPGSAASRSLLAALGRENRDLVFYGENLFSFKIY